MLKKSLLVGIAAALPLAAACAEPSGSYFNHKGWYAGADLGVASYYENNFVGTVESNQGTSGFALNGKVGYQMLPNVALEGDYTYYDYKSAHFNSVDGGVKAIMPLAARWGLYGKAGMMSYYKDTNSVVEPFLGLGALYAVDRHWQLDLQMTAGKLNGLLGSAEVGSYTAGLVYFF